MPCEHGCEKAVVREVYKRQHYLRGISFQSKPYDVCWPAVFAAVFLDQSERLNSTES
jgi:hypothetical protein